MTSLLLAACGSCTENQDVIDTAVVNALGDTVLLMPALVSNSWTVSRSALSTSAQKSLTLRSHPASLSVSLKV